MKLDMLFFLGFFATIYGIFLFIGWLLTGSLWNLYGILLLSTGLYLIITRPKPPFSFFVGHFKPDEEKTQNIQCWCGRFMKAGTNCDHGTGMDKAF